MHEATNQQRSIDLECRILSFRDLLAECFSKRTFV
jgi:hypothetical protein